MKPLVSLTVTQWEAVAKAIDVALERARRADKDLAAAKIAMEHQLGWADRDAGHTEPEYACRLCNPDEGAR